jgi:hypothetical protein
LWNELNIGLALDEGLANPENKYTVSKEQMLVFLTAQVFYGERCVWWVKFKATGPTGHGSRFIPRTAVEVSPHSSPSLTLKEIDGSSYSSIPLPNGTRISSEARMRVQARQCQEVG